MSSWDSDTSTATNYYYTNKHTNDYAEKEVKPKSNRNYYSKPIEQLVKAKILKGKLVVFSHHDSLILKDRDALAGNGIEVHYTDPIVLGHNDSPPLHYYNYAVIIDAIEYLPGIMSRANLIREALLTLRDEYDKACVIILVKTPKMVRELAEKNKYKELENTFVIPKNKLFSGCNINYVDVEELITTAQFAGAKTVVVGEDLDIDMTYIKAYFDVKKQSK